MVTNFPLHDVQADPQNQKTIHFHGYPRASDFPQACVPILESAQDFLQLSDVQQVGCTFHRLDCKNQFLHKDYAQLPDDYSLRVDCVLRVEYLNDSPQACAQDFIQTD